MPENQNQTTNENISKASYSPQNIPQYTPVAQPNLGPKKEAKPTKKSKSRLAKFITGTLVFLILIALIIIGIFALNLDTEVIKVKLNAIVVNQKDEPVQNASVFINGTKVLETNVTGKFIINNLKPGEIDVKISANGYADLEQKLQIQKNFPSYTVNAKFQLTSVSMGSLKGKFISPDKNYDFLNDRVVLNDKEYSINKDGTFLIEDIPTGNVKFKFTSINYKDVASDLDLKPELNTLKDITLERGGDIKGKFVSFIREELITNVDIQIESVKKENILINQDSTFSIKDLNVGKEYAIRIVAPGYLTRDYKVTIAQGENKIFDLNMVEEGLAVYQAKDTSSSNYNFNSSEFDGAKLTQLTNDSALKPTNEYYNSEGKLEYFLSTKEKPGSTIGASGLKMAYSLNIETNEIKKLITNIADIGVVVPNFKAKKLINVTKNPTTKNFVIKIMDLTGNSRITLSELAKDNSVTAAILSNDGKVIYEIEKNKLTGATHLYRINVETKAKKEVPMKPGISLLDVNGDGNRLIYTAQNTSTSYVDLLMYDATTSETRTLIIDAIGHDFRFAPNSDNTITYWDTIQAKDNIFVFQIDQSKSSVISNLGNTDQIAKIYWQGDFLFYITNKGLYVIDVLKPHSLKLVTSKPVQYKGDEKIIK